MKKYQANAYGWLRYSRMFTALLLSIVLVGCNSNDDDDHNVVDIAVAADASQEVPANASSATGSGTLSLNSETGELTGTITTSGMTATAAHIHEGAAGTNGGVIVALDVSGDTLMVPAGTVLTSDQIALMLAGDYYLNVHSSAYPGGEIRAQVASSDVDVLVVALNGESEVPPVVGAGSGTAYLTLNRASSMLTMNVSTTTGTAASAAHLHGGFAGENGGVLQALVQDASDASMFSFSGVADQATIDAIDAGGAYFNVHTAATPSGELRGQVLQAGVTVHKAELSGDQEVPAVLTSATGSGALTLNSNTQTATVVLNTTGVLTASAAHVHSGSAGSNGGVIFALEQDVTDANVWVARDASVDADGISAITSGNAYFNVHTPTNAGGEIRGQIN